MQKENKNTKKTGVHFLVAGLLLSPFLVAMVVTAFSVDTEGTSTFFALLGSLLPGTISFIFIALGLEKIFSKQNQGDISTDASTAMTASIAAKNLSQMESDLFALKAVTTIVSLILIIAVLSTGILLLTASMIFIVLSSILAPLIVILGVVLFVNLRNIKKTKRCN